ncbi:putative membrane protein [Marinomonas alcarazii]|uniref:Putative membrane protein n=1 Tax=Marinomonas alcarazii TaxID=491949 RepID=A0A318V7K6_9GAMM|nr:putative membrane protein [Marinomonas alcarazii]
MNQLPLSTIKNTSILKAYDTIKTSFWFTPCLILSLTILGCLTLLLIDLYAGLDTLPWLTFLYHASAEITRDLLTTVASSVMTVVSITFSITIVALTNASSQFGPRLIRNFMEDSSTQIVLGVFISLFVYCLILVRMTDDFAGGAFLPGLTIAGAIAMTLFGILLLIYFIHHVSLNLQSDSVIDNVYSELQSSIKQIFKQQKEEEDADSSTSQKQPQRTKTADKTRQQFQFQSQSCGYIQAINYADLTHVMSKLDGHLDILVNPGDFVVKRMVIMTSDIEAFSEEDRQTLHECFTLGPKRTPIQDPEFAVHQLVEIALRALSPGINDPYSAIACIDKLTAAVCDLTQKSFPEGITYDESGVERVTYKTTSFENLANIAFNQIRQYSQSCLAVQLRQLEGVIRIAEQANHSTHWSFVCHQKLMLEHGLEQQQLVDLDKQEVSTRLKTLNELTERA